MQAHSLAGPVLLKPGHGCNSPVLIEEISNDSVKINQTVHIQCGAIWIQHSTVTSSTGWQKSSMAQYKQN